MSATFWRSINPIVRPLAGIAPWWVLLETTGRRTGRRRTTPLAGGPLRGNVVCVLSVYGEASAFVRNIGADPRVRIRRRGRWRAGTATVVDVSPETTRRLGLYARHVLLRIASEPKIVQVVLAEGPESPSESR